MSAPRRQARRAAAPPLRGGQDMRLSVSLVVPRLSPRAARQNIASYAHRHGVVLTRMGQPVGTMAAVTLCRILRAAVDNSQGERRQRAEGLVRTIVRSLQGQGGPLCVPVPLLNVLRRYARRAGGARPVHPAAGAPAVSPAGDALATGRVASGPALPSEAPPTREGT
jgi:hypothetical protein